jgi:hypothetical protein
MTPDTWRQFDVAVLGAGGRYGASVAAGLIRHLLHDARRRRQGEPGQPAPRSWHVAAACRGSLADGGAARYMAGLLRLSPREGPQRGQESGGADGPAGWELLVPEGEASSGHSSAAAGLLLRVTVQQQQLVDGGGSRGGASAAALLPSPCAGTTFDFFCEGSGSVPLLQVRGAACQPVGSSAACTHAR